MVCSNNDLNPQVFYNNINAVMEALHSSIKTILDWGFISPVPMVGEIGFRKGQLALDPSEVQRSFQKIPDYHGRLLVTVEPCGLSFLEYKPVFDELPPENRRGFVARDCTPAYYECFRLGGFHYYVDDKRVGRVCRDIAAMISSEIEVLPCLPQ
jgi:hypothetical protein